MTNAAWPIGHYVYMLVDPRTGSPFYVGKGQRGRAWRHAEQVARGDLSGNTRKVAAIQDILRRGDDVEIQIVAEYELEDDALEHEFELVDSLPCLTNVLPGGGRLKRLTEKEIKDRQRARRERIAASFVNRKALMFDRQKEKLTANPRYAHNKHEIEAWYEAQRASIVALKDQVEVCQVQGNGRPRKGAIRVGKNTQVLMPFHSRPPKQKRIAEEVARLQAIMAEARQKDREEMKQTNASMTRRMKELVEKSERTPFK